MLLSATTLALLCTTYRDDMEPVQREHGKKKLKTLLHKKRENNIAKGRHRVITAQKCSGAPSLKVDTCQHSRLHKHNACILGHMSVMKQPDTMG